MIKFDKLEENILSVLLPLMVIIVFLGTLGRYSGLYSMAWYEEAARYIMIWMVFIGIGAGAKKNAHFVVELIYMITPEKLHKYIRVIVLLIVLFFNATVAILSIRLVKGLFNMQQVSPSLGLPMWAIYSAIPIGCCLMAARSLQYYFGTLKQSTKGDVA
ncbi:TRAP transporter small permease [Acetomicrobium hydrogeniformans]|uniref:TRAP transporter, DctQ-like membrane protein n=1 Tax=Acetomicrobium hydrogeniformans ATCC BAA-1850 TaxID=592015 RepID=A0A0T5XDW7_9BACT|nr:TRAP transporter small permease [Acetomicrobium hydrogeniformans]KRT36497.1 TRAP transporter, DctQ-like membrane protein [Acetomicrobium hydrogeniformans ATCC BAA-1850]